VGRGRKGQSGVEGKKEKEEIQRNRWDGGKKIDTEKEEARK